MTDILVTDHGSILLFRPLSTRAHAFFEANVASEGWQWFGGALAVEPRYAPGLIDLALEAGLDV